MLHAWFSGEIIPSLVLDLTRGHRGGAALLNLPIAQLKVFYDLLRDHILVLERERSVLDDRQGVHLSTSSRDQVDKRLTRAVTRSWFALKKVGGCIIPETKAS